MNFRFSTWPVHKVIHISNTFFHKKDRQTPCFWGFRKSGTGFLHILHEYFSVYCRFSTFLWKTYVEKLACAAFAKSLSKVPNLLFFAKRA